MIGAVVSTGHSTTHFRVKPFRQCQDAKCTTICQLELWYSELPSAAKPQCYFATNLKAKVDKRPTWV